MIKLKMSIEDISEYQTGILPKNAVKIETPQSIEEMMKKAAPIAAVLCVLMFVTMLCKTVMNKTVVISHVFILIGFCLGIAGIIGTVLISDILISSLLGVFSFSSFWTIKEIFEQRERVLKGWFPMNPKRKHEYE